VQHSPRFTVYLIGDLVYLSFSFEIIIYHIRKIYMSSTIMNENG
jgi:hypothetical protein